jgi:hypothetical protein
MLSSGDAYIENILSPREQIVMIICAATLARHVFFVETVAMVERRELKTGGRERERETSKLHPTLLTVGFPNETSSTQLHRESGCKRSPSNAPTKVMRS